MYMGGAPVVVDVEGGHLGRGVAEGLVHVHHLHANKQARQGRQHGATEVGRADSRKATPARAKHAGGLYKARKGTVGTAATFPLLRSTIGTKSIG
jgi:hypothetical protein